MIFFPITMHRLFSTEFWTNFDLFFLFYTLRLHGFYCYFSKCTFWSIKNNFYFSPSVGVVRQSTEKLGWDPSLGLSRAQILAKIFLNESKSYLL